MSLFQLFKIEVLFFTHGLVAVVLDFTDFRYYKKHGSPTRISPPQECMFKSQNQSPQESYSVENFIGVFKFQWNRKPHEIFFSDGFSAEILSVFFKANRIFTVVDDVFQFSGIALLLKLVSGCSFLQLLLST